MLVSRVSPFSGKEHIWDLPITVEQVEDYLNGTLIQNAFPHLNADQREFFMTGITPQEWEETFGDN